MKHPQSAWVVILISVLIAGPLIRCWAYFWAREGSQRGLGNLLRCAASTTTTRRVLPGIVISMLVLVGIGTVVLLQARRAKYKALVAVRTAEFNELQARHAALMKQLQADGPDGQPVARGATRHGALGSQPATAPPFRANGPK